MKQNAAQSAALTSLFIQALRQGQPVWFRVVSGSMLPLVRVGDAVYIEPTSSDLQVGDIAAFETPAGLVVHRLVHYEQTANQARYVEMGDAALLAHHVDEQAIVGRVTNIRRATRQVDIRLPVAQRWGKVTARIRFRLYSIDKVIKFNPARFLIRKCARLVALVGSVCIRVTSSSTVSDALPYAGTL